MMTVVSPSVIRRLIVPWPTFRLRLSFDAVVRREFRYQVALGFREFVYYIDGA